MWGLEHPETGQAVGTILSPSIPIATSSTVVSRLSRYSYGLAFNESFDLTQHRIDDCYKDMETGRYMARDQMTWLLKRVSKPRSDKLQVRLMQHRARKSRRERSFTQTAQLLSTLDSGIAD